MIYKELRQLSTFFNHIIEKKPRNLTWNFSIFSGHVYLSMVVVAI